ncbi:MAG: hypothetical protein LBM17_01685 [Candidatus Accumulibacter sp.]|jgi:hypothetical protein|nr:hypothetical protein [Accumulibacter sp.]
MNTTDNPAPADALYISDLREGEYVLERVPLDDPRRAEVELSRFLDALLNPVLDSRTIYALLELAAEDVAFVAKELAKEYLDQPLPLDESQENTFVRVIALWEKMARLYDYCISPAERQDFRNNVQRHAEVLYRCIHYFCISVLEYQRARQEYAPGLLVKLHSYYARAERAGIDSLVIVDPFEAEKETNCAAEYLTAFLCDAADRHRLTTIDQSLVYRWASLWAPLVTLHRIDAKDALPPLVLDLSQDRPLFFSANLAWNENLRRMATDRLLLRIQRIEQRLKQQIPPSKLGLGINCTAGQCLSLLKHLSAPWSQTKASRKFRRLPASSRPTARLCTGFEEIFFFVSGKPFKQRAEERNYSRDNFEMQFIFRQESALSNYHVQIGNEAQKFTPDDWGVADQSLNGLRLVCDKPANRIAPGQLLAVTLPGETAFMLGRMVWVVQNAARGLMAGVRTFLGAHVAVTVRFVEKSFDQTEAWYPGFLLEALPTLGEVEALILPSRFYRPDVRVELTGGNGVVRHVVLRQVIESGYDFDRVGFAVVE